MNIALLGYGNMGQEIEQLVVKEDTHKIVSISFKDGSRKFDKNGLKKADVVIDFTSPEVVLQNIEAVASLGMPLVVGTTGWFEKIAQVKKIINTYKTGLLYGGNFSIGANIFFKVIAYASSLVNEFGNSEYDVAGFEMHHTGKKDSPSGTAKTISDIVLQTSSEKKEVQTGRLDRKIKKEELHFASLRIGRNPGRHGVIFDSNADEIILTHQAHNREGFAKGAILAAEFIKDKKGMYTFEEIFNNTMSS